MANFSSLTGLLPSPHGNASLIENSELCTLALCDLTLAHLDYLPSLAGNVLFAVLFGLTFIAQILLGLRYRTWGYTIAASLGTLTEIIGYAGRVLMHENPFHDSNFLLYIVTLTIAPAFMTAAIYLCLSRIVVVYGEEHSRFRPRTYTILFCGCDFLALLLQAAGGAIASGSNTQSTVSFPAHLFSIFDQVLSLINNQTQVGINVMLAGLSFQVFSLLLFVAACLEFAFRVYNTPSPYASNCQNLRTSPPTSIAAGTPLHTILPKTALFRGFLVGLAVATLTIFIRSTFRVAELSGGFDGRLANDEVSFMVLEGTMVIIACVALTLCHPGLCFQGEWRAANFKMGREKNASGNQGKRLSSGSSLGTSVLERRGREPPLYNESILSMISGVESFEIGNTGASEEGLRASVLKTTPVRPHQVQVEMVPVYGVRYESTSDLHPAPST